MHGGFNKAAGVNNHKVCAVVVGALVLGIGQSLAATKLIGVNIGWFSLADLQYAVSPVLLFFAMLFLPSERLRAGAAKRVRESWRLPSLRTAAWGALGFVVAVVAATDLIGADPDRAGLVTALSFALVALSLVPLTGMAGQISLAQMSFFGVGALIMSWIGDDGHTVAGLIVAIAVSAVVGGLVALPALRLTGLYLALGTAAFSLFMTRMVFKQTRLMPGDQVAVPGLDLGFATFRTNQAQITLLANLLRCGVKKLNHLCEFWRLGVLCRPMGSRKYVVLLYFFPALRRVIRRVSG